MIVNKKTNDNRVKFISYDGKYPNLCRGVLTLEIDGEIVKFGHHYSNCHYNEDKKNYFFSDEVPNKPNYEKFWSSGGDIRHDGHWNNINVCKNEWIIDYEALPEKFHDLAEEINEIFNENVEYGCCGGCI